ncbi:MAG: phosphate ABC transporter permease subunit PstC [Myxococcales bacterium]|nr:phosphate ABC transporter permease subunit PstC [Myxococcales bacterium]
MIERSVDDRAPSQPAPVDQPGAGPLRGRRATPRSHAVAERMIAGAALLTVLLVVLVLAFVLREAAPLVLDHEERRGADLASLAVPRQWPGYERSEWVWQPVGEPAKFNAVPLLVGSLKIAGTAVSIATPTGVLAALALWQLDSRRARRWIKPLVELLASVPSVVLGAWALSVLATVVQSALGLVWRLNALTAAIALSLAVAPLIFTVTDDALAAVPRETIEGAVALGARRYQVALRVLVPAALPGIAAAATLGLGRAIGETMIVLMVSGNSPVLRPLDPTTSARTVTATIASELGEVVQGSVHWRVLFLLGALLFILTLVLNALAAASTRALSRRLRGDA